MIKLVTVVLAVLVAGPPTRITWNQPRVRHYNQQEAEPVATRIWQSTTGIWNAASFGGNLPSASDIVIFDGAISNVAVTQGLDAPVLINVVQFRVKPSYTADIGLASAGLQIGCAQLLYHGSGTFFWDQKTTGTQFVVVDSENLFDAVHVRSSASILILPHVKRGKMIFEDACLDLSTIHVIGRDAKLDLLGTTNQIKAVHMIDGEVNNYRAHQSGTEWVVMQSGGVWNDWGDDLFNVHLYGGTFNVDMVAGGSGINIAVVHGGTLNALSHKALDIAFLVIGPYGDVNLTDQVTHSGYKLDLRDEVVELP